MDKYIIQLLKLHYKIILPDFGAIVIADEESGELMFNEFLNYDDKKLAELLEQESNMNLQEAQNAVAKFVRELKYHLDKGNTYAIFQLGEFTKEKDAYVFTGNIKTGVVNRKVEEGLESPVAPTPLPTASLLEEMLQHGTEKEVVEENRPLVEENETSSPIVPQEESAKEIQQEATPIEEVEESPILVAVHPRAISPILGEINPNSDKNDKNPKRKGIYGVFALLTVLVIIALLIFTNKDSLFGNGNNVVENEDATTEIEAEAVHSEGMNEDVTEEDVLAEDNAKDEDSMEDMVAENDVTENSSSSSPVANSTGNYHIVFGAFSEQSNAEKAVSEMKEQGFGAKVLGPFTSKQLYYAAAQSYSTEGEAQADLSRITAVKPHAWIFKH